MQKRRMLAEFSGLSEGEDMMGNGSTIGDTPLVGLSSSKEPLCLLAEQTLKRLPRASCCCREET